VHQPPRAPARRLLGGLGLALLWACLATAHAAQAAARDWTACPALVEVDTDADVYALGDVHGDYERLVALLVATGMVPAPPDRPGDVGWAAGRAVLVVTGDVIDKWDRGVEAIELLRVLAAAAAGDGGRVIVTAGNHEAEFLDDPGNSKAKPFRQELKARGLKPKEVARGEDPEGLGAYLRCLPFAVRVDDAFFSHAGSTKGRTLAELVADLRRGVDEDGYAAKVLAGKKGLLEARMKPRPWWEKRKDDASESEARLRQYAEALGVDHVVFGHQPGKYDFSDGTRRKKGEMLAKFDGLVVLIDVGMSRGIGSDGEGYSEGALLRIRRTDGEETGTALDARGGTKLLWTSD
jgi:hypothetical protein